MNSHGNVLFKGDSKVGILIFLFGVFVLCATYLYFSIPSLKLSKQSNKLLVRLRNEPKEITEEHQTRDKRLLIFNRVQKAGSSMMNRVLGGMSRQNQFKIVLRYAGLNDNHSRQFQDLHEFVQIVCQTKTRPFLFSQHHHFIDFTHFNNCGSGIPLYFNIVRDPLERVASKFHYSRRATLATEKSNFFEHQIREMEPQALGNKTYEDWISFDWETCVSQEDRECVPHYGDIVDSQIAYFCGQGIDCVKWKNPVALKQAKANVEKHFPVVAVLENLNGSFTAMDRLLPLFCHDISKYYYTRLKGRKIGSSLLRKKLPDLLIGKMREVLSHEYEFYDFIERRLKTQIKEVS